MLIHDTKPPVQILKTNLFLYSFFGFTFILYILNVPFIK